MSVTIQLRVDNNHLHVQGKGKSVNRPYGVAVDVASHPTITQIISNFNNTVQSLYPSSGKRYVVGLAEIYGEIPKSVMVMLGDTSFVITSEPLFQFVKRMSA